MPIDYSKYPPNWKTEIVPAVLARAGYCCELCGLKNYQKVFAINLKVSEGYRYKQRSIWFRVREDAERELVFGEVREIKVVLTIAHLDHDELNHAVELNRLKALCQLCHLRYDAKEKYERSLVKWKEH